MTVDRSPADLRAPRSRGRLRGAILQRAAELASLGGLEHITIGRLAAAMQMSKSGLYAYFTSKQDLQLATIDLAWRVFEEHVLEPGDDPIDDLLERWISYYENEVFPGGCPFVTAGAEFANRDGPVRDALAAALQRQLTALQNAVARSHASRLVSGGDPGQVAFELYAILTAANQRFRLTRDPAAFAHARAAIARLLWADPAGAGQVPASGDEDGGPAPLPAAGIVERAALPRPPAPPAALGDAGEGDDARAAPARIDRHPAAATGVLALDHIGLAVGDVDAMRHFLCDHLGLQPLGRGADGVRVGAGDGATSVSLIAAQGPREPAALARVVLRVADLELAVASLPDDLEVEEEEPDLVTFEGPEGLGVGFALVAGGAAERDLDHLVLRVALPEETGAAMTALGCVPNGDTLHIADKRIRLEELPAFSERPLLDHIAIRVPSTEPVLAQARAGGLEIEERPAGGGRAIVLPGPERIRVALVAVESAP